MKIILNGKNKNFSKPLTLLEIAKEDGFKEAIAATVDGRLRELSYRLDKDATVEFLTLTNRDAVRIYEASLRYVIAMAVENLYPKSNVIFNYSVSRSIMAQLTDFPEVVTPTIVKKISQEISRIVKADYPIKRISVSIEEAKKIYAKRGLLDKVAVLDYRPEEKVNLYEANGYINYMFGYMIPSTGLLTKFNLFEYNPGFIVQYPRAEFDGEIPGFTDAPVFGKALEDARKWGEIIGGNNIPRINERAANEKDAIDFVNLCETKHNNQLCDLGKQIYDGRDGIRLIAVAGPSSSGKTTFTNRLRIELLSRGMKPVMISMDDYYYPKSQAPVDEFGKPDLEHIEALDIAQFNQDMLALVQGEEVTLPLFNFITGKREAGKKVRVAGDAIIMIEGIHALNDRLTSRIPKHQKYKIYIAPQTQLHIDNHNPISITDLRLLRRSVRDQRVRNSSATDTMDMWDSVRRGEFKWIYPFQEDANFVFNSELTYELGVLKKYAIAQLSVIKNDSEHFITANRLIKFLKYFTAIPDEYVPNNSLLREFIGGSAFHD